MRVFKTLAVFIVILISIIVKISTRKVQVRVTATPLCLGGLLDTNIENIKAEIGKLGKKGYIIPQNTTDGECNSRISIHADVKDFNINDSAIYTNYTYSQSHKNITKKIPDDCENRDDDIQEDFGRKYYFLCNLGYLDPNQKTKS
uniref:Astacin domain-containing protein n=1 Tax=Strongyloides papillosus TaxID=174720 RepID=A0A0N5BIN7_STREA